MGPNASPSGGARPSGLPGLGLLLARQGAVTTCSEGNRYGASSLRRPRVRGKMRRQLRLHSAPPLPLFSSDAAVEASAAAAASPAARGAPTRSPSPTSSSLRASSVRARGAQGGVVGKRKKGQRRKPPSGKKREGGRERLLGDLRHRSAPLSSRPSLWSEARAPH